MRVCVCLVIVIVAGRGFLKVLIVGFYMGTNISFHLPVKMVPIKINSPEDVGNVLFSHGPLPEGVRKWILLFSEGFPPLSGYL